MSDYRILLLYLAMCQIAKESTFLLKLNIWDGSSTSCRTSSTMRLPSSESLPLDPGFLSWVTMLEICSKLCETLLINRNEQNVSQFVNIAHLHYLLLQPIAIWQILPEECSNFWCFFLNILDFVDSQQTCSPLLFYSEFLHQLAFPFYQPS